MRAIFLFSLVLLFSGCASAQTAIERKFIPGASLDFPAFASSDDASTIKIDNRAWNAFLEAYVSTGPTGVALVDYGSVADTDRATLKAYIGLLENTDPTTLTSDDQLAFWINLYNAVTVNLILDAYPLDSIRDIKSGPFDFDGPWDDERTKVSSVALSLNDIEHKIIRSVFNEPRIHYAVNCASIGCPDIRMQAYEGESIDISLTEQARAYINHPRGVNVNKRGNVTASKIFTWYSKDFGANENEILNHIRQFADPKLLEKLKSAEKISRYRYDWSLNAPVKPVNE